VYKYVKFREENGENIPAIRDRNGKLFTEEIQKANSLKSYYTSLFICENNNLQIQSTQSGKPFTISNNVIRKRLSAIGRKISVVPDGIPAETLKLYG
jgi:hypothetical protein